jgi:hypothetical protein
LQAGAVFHKLARELLDFDIPRALFGDAAGVNLEDSTSARFGEKCGADGRIRR